MMQGDSAYLGIRILNNAGSAVTPQDIEDVEITIGNLHKSHRKAQLSYSDGLWFFPLSQSESFGCTPRSLRAQVRVKWANGVVEGCPLYGVRIHESISKEVL